MAHLDRLRTPLTVHNIFSDDVDMLISVWSSVFMPETDNMSQFVDDNAELVAVFSDADCLGTVSSFSNEGATPESINII